MLLYSAGLSRLVGVGEINPRVAAFQPGQSVFSPMTCRAGNLDNTTVSLNIDNVGDESPPFEKPERRQRHCERPDVWPAISMWEFAKKVFENLADCRRPGARQLSVGEH